MWGSPQIRRLWSAGLGEASGPTAIASSATFHSLPPALPGGEQGPHWRLCVEGHSLPTLHGKPGLIVGPGSLN